MSLYKCLCICSSSNIKPRLCRPLAWVLVWVFCVCVSYSFCNSKLGPLLLLLLISWGKKPRRCVFLRISYVDALKKKHDTNKTNGFLFIFFLLYHQNEHFASSPSLFCSLFLRRTLTHSRVGVSVTKLHLKKTTTTKKTNVHMSFARPQAPSFTRLVSRYCRF